MLTPLDYDKRLSQAQTNGDENNPKLLVNTVEN